MAGTEIEAVLFDVGGVLHTLASTYVETVDMKQAIPDQTLRESIWVRHVVGEMGRGTLGEAAFYMLLAQHYGVVLTDPIDLFRQGFEEAVMPNLAMFALAGCIRSLGIVTAVFSNTIAPHEDVLRRGGVYDGFQHEFLSWKTGYQKPDPQAYRHVIDTLGFDPASMILIDDREANVRAATTAGMLGLQYVYADDPNAKLLLDVLKQRIPGL